MSLSGRYKNRDYLDRVREMPCVACRQLEILDPFKRPKQRTPTEAHHEAVAEGFRGAQKSRCDYGAVPLCSYHHIEERHGRLGRDAFWSKHFGPGGHAVPHILVAEQLRAWASYNHQDIAFALDQWDAYVSGGLLTDLARGHLFELVRMLCDAVAPEED